MKIRALQNFCGTVSMSVGQVAEVEDEALAADLLRAGYAEKVKEAEEPEKAEESDEQEKTEEAEEPEKEKKPKRKAKKSGDVSEDQ